jgi:hypothetical protein
VTGITYEDVRKLIFELFDEVCSPDRLYVRLHNFFVYFFIRRFSQHVSVVYDHHQVVFTSILTPVLLLLLLYLSLHPVFNVKW